MRNECFAGSVRVDVCWGCQGSVSFRKRERWREWKSQKAERKLGIVVCLGSKNLSANRANYCYLRFISVRLDLTRIEACGNVSYIFGSESYTAKTGKQLKYRSKENRIVVVSQHP